MAPRLPGGAFAKGLYCGIGLVLLGRLFVNHTTLADRLVAPLLIADSTADGDAIVVLGAGVVAECVVNLNALRRVVLGVRLFRQGRAPILVFTGGTGTDRCAVADSMAALARDFGVPEDKIVVERQSQSTRENGLLTAPLLEERKISRLVLVTDSLHMRRARGVFWRLGFQVEPSAVPIYEGGPDNVAMLTAGGREAAALFYYRLRGWLSGEAAPGSSLVPERVPAGDPVRPAGPISSNPDGSPRSAGDSPRPHQPIVLLGASYAANWRLDRIGETPVINAGVAGQQSFEMLERFDRDVVSANPRAVVLFGFINDLFRAPQIDESPERIRESYRAMIARSRNHSIEPVLATELTVRARKTLTDTAMTTLGHLLQKRSYQDQINERVVAVNAWLRETAQRENILLLDLQRTLGDGDGPRRWAYAVEDGSHVSEEGYRVLTDYVRPLLASRFGDRSAVDPARP